MTPEEHEAKLDRIEELWDFPEGTPEADECYALCEEVSEYEDSLNLFGEMDGRRKDTAG